MGIKTKIDWCDSTWNPVTGCLHGCGYCYARGIAERFSTEHKNPRPYIPVSDVPTRRVRTKPEPYPYGFKPTFHRYRLDQPSKWSEPRTIFVCSMADLFGEWVPDDWIQAVFKACDAAPQHRYLFLTKNPKRLCRMANAARIFKWNLRAPKPHPETKKYKDVPMLPVRDNWWFGSTLDGANATRFEGDRTWNTFTSIEPLREHMHMGIGSFGSDQWTIIGAETGSRKGKIVPEREWVENITEAAEITGVKVFMKESLHELMGDDFRQEFPWEV